MWRIGSANGWWSAFGKKRGKNGKKVGPPVHDDLVKRDFTAEAPNQLWLADITEHRTGEGKLYLCTGTQSLPPREAETNARERFLKSALGHRRGM